MTTRATAQMIVDCEDTGSYPGSFTSIKDAINAAGNYGTVLIVPGTCNQNVDISGVSNVSLGAWWDRVAIKGNVQVDASNNIYLHGLDVTSSDGRGFGVGSASQDIMIDSCTSSGNTGSGVEIYQGSSVFILNWGSFSNNGGNGFWVGEGSKLYLAAWGGPIVIDNNPVYGVNVAASDFFAYGNVQISNTTGGPYVGYGLQLVGGSRGMIWTDFGDVRIKGNQSAGVVVSGSTLMIRATPGTPFLNYIEGNGPTGILVGAGSRLVLGGAGYITGHSDTGVDVYSNSQLAMWGQNFIQSNTGKAGIRLDGNSGATIYSSTISGNSGPGILALTNSSFVAQANVITSNSGGPLLCDSTSYAATDLLPAELGPAVSCKISNSPGLHHDNLQPPTYTKPVWKPLKDIEERFLKLAASKRH